MLGLKQLIHFSSKGRIWKPKFCGAIPHFLQPQMRDPFDYPLRTKQELLEQQGDKPLIDYPYEVEYILFPDNVKFKADYNRRIKIFVKMDDLKLTEKQRERLIFLLGRRYKNDGMIKIGVDMYFKPEENLKKAIEMVNELYLEALRAP